MSEGADLTHDFTNGYLALRGDGGVAPIERDLVRVSGPEAATFLQGQLSQDVESLRPTASRWSFLLQPTGKVDVWLRVTRAGGEDFLLDTDASFGDRVVERLVRFKLRTKVDVERVAGWYWLAARAARPIDVPSIEDAFALSVSWPGIHGVDVLCQSDSPVLAALPRVSRDAYDAVRVECGVPEMGAELTDATIPAEAGQWVIDASVSFTKGCYTGQELVARVDSRGGNVPRPLRGVVVGTNTRPPVGTKVIVGDDEVGELTSVAESLELRAPIALAVIARKIEPPAAVTVRWEGGESPAELRSLPMV